MRKKLDNIHVFSTLVLNFVLLILVICSDNPLIVGGIFIPIMCILVVASKLSSLKRSILLFVPFAILTIIINLIFVTQGKTIIFILFNRAFTLEAFIYALSLSFKLLLVILIFMLLGVMIDSDKAVSFFSSVMPKTTVTMMISLKMFPQMKKRMTSLREIYSIRGVDFKAKGLKNKIKTYVPLLSVILEDSLESAFDIGESSFVRGFLSSKRTVYDRKKFINNDYIILFSSMILLGAFIIIKALGKDNFNVYDDINLSKIINKGSITIFILTFVLAGELLCILKEKKYVIH
ncbi:energy-coupling factor transporter transmembrane component T [Clostridium akagii]|uniref:energy-coupling factor transporter transmembrane component T n=1 Tax=Clostridium akagii TaxID=91623 RepID=UPI00068D035C|nr:energy-coupling factor transporter transmembrane component T [Clostridium akagii]